MEKLIIIAIIVGASIIHNWWTKRQQEESEQPDPNPDASGRRPPPLPPPSGQPGRSAQGQNQPGGGWEEELRRLLQGETPTPRPPVQRPTPPPPPVVKTRPVAQSAVPRPFLARSSIPVPDVGREMEIGLPVRPVALDQASAAHERASHLQASVIQRMRDTTAKVSAHAKAGPTLRQATYADRLRSLLGENESLRTMVVASVILGPPKGSEP